LHVVGRSRGKTELKVKLVGETLEAHKAKRGRRGALLHKNLVPTVVGACG
jgi:hypothetical protein